VENFFGFDFRLAKRVIVTAEELRLYLTADWNTGECRQCTLKSVLNI
jgi:hypothetical protein